MEQQRRVPWAETVVTVSYPMSLEDFITWPGEDCNDDNRCELVNGRVVRNPFFFGLHSVIHCNVLNAMLRYEETHPEYAFVGCHCILNLPDEAQGTCLKVTDGLVHAERFPAPEDTAAWNRPLELVPELVVEIAREGQSREAMAEKARLWLIAGARLVWIIRPGEQEGEQEVDVWLPSSPEPIQTLKLGDYLNGLEVAPGFSYPVADLFKL